MNCFYCKKELEKIIILKKYEDENVRIYCPHCNKEFRDVIKKNGTNRKEK
jgi:hypothetical protein